MLRPLLYLLEKDFLDWDLLEGDCYGLRWLEPLPFSCPLVCPHTWTISSCLYKACHSKENALNNNNNEVLQTSLGVFVNLHELLDYNNFNTKLHKSSVQPEDSERLQTNEWFIANSLANHFEQPWSISHLLAITRLLLFLSEFSPPSVQSQTVLTREEPPQTLTKSIIVQRRTWDVITIHLQVWLSAPTNWIRKKKSQK